MTDILIADDNRANLYLLESILKGNGYRVSSARNGAEALAAARSSAPDLIITDILMPVMDGFELCRQWKADGRLKHIPFIFYTATYTDPKDEKFAMSLGADRFIVKPQKPEFLVQLVHEVLVETRRKNHLPPEHPLGDEMEVLRQYNEVLFRKLEKKMLQLEKTVQELEEKNAELARFTYTVSHELRSPLITIKGFSGLIEEESGRESPNRTELISHARHISSAVDTLDLVLADLLRLSRAGKIIETRRPVDLTGVAGEAVNLVSPLPDGVSIRIDPDLPVIDADRARIREALVNIFENAITFRGTTPDLEIRMGVDRSGKEPVFFIRDNGMGIESKYLERIFNLFEKLDGRTKGTGSGLPVTRRIIEAHGGTIWAESEGPGKGTTFRFTLPVAGTVNNNNEKIKE